MSSKGIANTFVGLGTKPGLHAQTLISTGQADLDQILGGGLPLGAVLVLLEDAFSQHHKTLVKYFVAEGLACGQAVHWVSPIACNSEPLQGLPQVVEPSAVVPEASPSAGSDKDGGLRIAWQYRRYIQDKQKAAEASRQSSAFQRKTKGGTAPPSKVKDWCHSFDLTRPMKGDASGLERHAYRGSNAVPSLLEAVQSWADRLPSRDAEPQKPLSADLRALVESAISSSIPLPTMPERPIRRLQTSMASRPAPASESLAAESIKKGLPAREGPAECNGSCVAGSPSTQESGQGGAASQPLSRTSDGSSPVSPEIGRLAIQSLGSWQWDMNAAASDPQTEILATVHRLKGLARRKHLAVMLTVPSGLYHDDLGLKLQHICDGALILDSITDDSAILKLITDPRSCCGTLRATKLPGLNTTTAPVPQSQLYIIRHKRRSITLQPFEVDPDAEAALASESNGSASSPAAALLCGGAPGADNKTFDF